MKYYRIMATKYLTYALGLVVTVALGIYVGFELASIVHPNTSPCYIPNGNCYSQK